MAAISSAQLKKWQTLIIQAEENDVGDISMSESYRPVILLLALFVLLIPALAESPDNYTVKSPK